jgi:hypothetical protein
MLRRRSGAHGKAFSMTSLRRLLLRTLVVTPLTASLGACTINSTTNDDGGTSGNDSGTSADTAAPEPDGGTSGDGGARAESSTGTDGGTSPLGFSPSNLGGLLGTLDLTKLVDIDVTGTSNELSVSCNSLGNGGCVSATVTQSDGSAAQVYVARSWKIEPSALLAVTDKMPVIVVATATIQVLGRLDGSASSQFPVAGGYAPAAPGPGVGGAGMNGNQTAAGVGAGGAGFCGLGGAGGAAAGSSGTAGKAYGSATLIPLLGGSAGGPGDLAPGAGGGAIELVAGVSIDIGAMGVISVGGGGGSSGDTTHGTSGGGSGGALLLEAPVVTIEGTLAANGGGGGGGTNANAPVSDATPNATAAPGGAQGTTGVGGAGSAGAMVTGGAGGAGDAVGGMNAPGAGGGGAGWIRVNTTNGSAMLTGTLSPASASACVTQGTLAK